jgi:hypothetical protein
MEALNDQARETEIGVPKAPTRTRNRSAKRRLITLEDLDRRCRAAQRALDLQDRLIAERGGTEHLSVLRFEMIRSVAVLSAMIEDQQARWINGEAVLPTDIATLLNARRREAELVGVDPIPRDVTTLASYLTTARNARGESQDSFSDARATQPAPDAQNAPARLP